jgi:anaerobic magnesium-protoporphyrin IX monomethyl ester cyclase
MRVTLVSPPFQALTASPPLGLGILASLLEAQGHRVSLLDFTVGAPSVEDAAVGIAATRPELVGINIKAPSFRSVQQLVAALRRRCAAPVVLGGPQATFSPELCLRAIGSDFVVMGEGEHPLPALVDALRDGGSLAIPGLARLEAGVIRLELPGPLVRDLDSLPLPAWHLMPPAGYPVPPEIFYRRFPVATVMTSRGCPKRCLYCASPAVFGGRYRTRSPEAVVDEIELLVRDFGIQEFQVVDDCLNGSRDHAAAFCEALLRRGLNLPWKNPCGLTLEHLDGELIQLLAASGCYETGLGIESMDPEILRGVRKPWVDPESVFPKLQALRRVGISPLGYFILGLPGETLDSLRRTVDFAVEAPLDVAHFAICAPMPGSELFERVVGVGLQAQERFFATGEHDPICELPQDLLRRELQRAHLRFYARRWRWAKLLRRVRPGQLSAAARMTGRYLGWSGSARAR